MQDTNSKCPTDIIVFKCNSCDEHHGTFRTAYDQLDSTEHSVVTVFEAGDDHYNNAANILLTEGANALSVYLLGARTAHEVSEKTSELHVTITGTPADTPVTPKLEVIKAASVYSPKERLTWYQSEVSRIQAELLTIRQ